MLYQNILTEIAPYQARVGSLEGFGEHRHGDIELHYCIKGCFDAIINKKVCRIKEGELLLIHPMAAHSFPSSEDKGREILILIAGVSFLKKYFSYFAHAAGDHCVIDVRESQNGTAFAAALLETADLCREEKEKNELFLRGNLYKICAYLIEILAKDEEESSATDRERAKIAGIEKALEMIYYNYDKPITLEDAARETGYAKSNFCKIFKSITGKTFHHVLNCQRVESACNLLTETDLSVSEIALRVGFLEAKTFCRVFKEITALTPGQYRKDKM